MRDLNRTSRFALLALLAVQLGACSSKGTRPEATTGESPPPTAGDDGKPEPETPQPEPRPQVDLSTDEAVRAAFKEATGSEMHEDDCIGRTGFQDVILIGSFAHDAGCMLQAAFIGGEFLDHAGFAQGALGRVGWRDLKPEDRPAFALDWAQKVLYHWHGDVVTESVKAFEFEDTPAFTAPESKLDGDDAVVTAWIEEPPGMIDADSFNLVEMRFSPDGVVMRNVKESFSVDGERLRGAG